MENEKELSSIFGRSGPSYMGLIGHILEGVGFFTSLSNFSSPHAVVGDFITYTDIFFKGSGL